MKVVAGVGTLEMDSSEGVRGMGYPVVDGHATTGRVDEGERGMADRGGCKQWQ